MLKDDLLYAIRSFGKSPGFALVVVLTLALGIGGTTAVFSLANALILRPMPFPAPERLVSLFTYSDQTTPYETNGYLDMLEWRRQATSFEDMSAFANWRELNLTGGDEPQRVLTAIVTSNYLPMLGVDPVLGRLFGPEEDRVPNGHPLILLSHALWRRNFGGDPDILGKRIFLNDRPYTVIGVLPPGFHDVAAHGKVDVWVPIMMAPTILDSPVDPFTERTNRWASVLARLKPGKTIEEAQAEINVINERLVQENPATHQGYRVLIAPFSVYLYQQRDISRSTMVLLIGAVFVLLIGCVNVANLLIVRGTAKQKEYALRLALGADRKHLIRQALTESVLLSLIGGTLGVLLAYWGLKGLVALNPIPIPAYVQIALDNRALAIALFVSMLSGIAFGLAPALSSARTNIRGTLSEGSRKSVSDSKARRVSRSLFVISEVALAMVLLMGAMLMIRSFLVFRGTPMGFDTENVVLAQTELSTVRYASPEDLRGFYRNLDARLRSLPGVQDVGLWGPDRPGLSWAMGHVRAEGSSEDEDPARVWVHRVYPGTLKALGIPLLRGRDLSFQDTPDTPPVAVVSQSFAEGLWPGQDPIGKRFTPGPPTNLWYTVIGVAADARHRGREPVYHDPRDFYTSFEQRPLPRMAFFLRMQGAPTTVLAPLRAAIKELDPGLTIYNLKTMEQIQAEEERETRFYAMTTGLFALIATLLAALGVYGVLSYSVAQRTHEIGVRMAMGARRENIFRLVGGQAMRLVLIGLLIGLAGTYALTRLMASLLYGVQASDPSHFLAITIVLLCVSMVAVYLPVRRAVRVDPLVALRQD